MHRCFLAGFRFLTHVPGRQNFLPSLLSILTLFPAMVIEPLPLPPAFLALLSREELGMPFHLGNEALSLLSKPLVLNLLHVGITWETLNITDDLV